MSYISIILVILLVLTVLFFITNKTVISYDNAWIKLVKTRIVKEADRDYLFREDGDLIINKKKRLKWTSSGLEPVGNDYHDTAFRTIEALENYEDKGYLKKAAAFADKEVRLRSKYKTYNV